MSFPIVFCANEEKSSFSSRKILFLFFAKIGVMDGDEKIWKSRKRKLSSGPFLYRGARSKTVFPTYSQVVAATAFGPRLIEIGPFKKREKEGLFLLSRPPRHI